MTRKLPALVLALCVLAPFAFAQRSSGPARLPRDRYTSGESTLRALAPLSAATRSSIVKFNVDGTTVALGTVVDASGLVLTKASELKRGTLTCWLATEKEVKAEVLAVDEDEDLALVRVQARDLKPIQWAEGDAAIGQWAVTPGIAATPQAVGIVSALPHRIRPPRALIGVQFDFRSPKPVIETVFPGLGAEKVGLKPGDIIVGVNGHAVTNREEIVEILRDFEAGRNVKLRVQRHETQFTATVRMMTPKAGQLDVPSDSAREYSRLRGQVSLRSEGFQQVIEHDTPLQPWLCGGPLLNLDGKAIGINIARASRVSTYALPAPLVKRELYNLKSGVKR